ncbi:hypothetical protein VNO77_38950 [Canavalia gladiata]|uniref:Uncharacterized protein n=1 Tax=Canavalia gladiata TaxID=3824 RepID=A0AAN9KA68_CANGL
MAFQNHDLASIRRHSQWPYYHHRGDLKNVFTDLTSSGLRGMRWKHRESLGSLSNTRAIICSSQPSPLDINSIRTKGRLAGFESERFVMTMRRADLTYRSTWFLPKFPYYSTRHTTFVKKKMVLREQTQPRNEQMLQNYVHRRNLISYLSSLVIPKKEPSLEFFSIDPSMESFCEPKETARVRRPFDITNVDTNHCCRKGHYGCLGSKWVEKK